MQSASVEDGEMKTIRILLLALVGMLPTLPAMADDIDIYTQSVGTSTDNATVLLTLDVNARLSGILCSNILLGKVLAAGDSDACDTLNSNTTLGNLLTFLGFATLTDYLKSELCVSLATLACNLVIIPIIASVNTIAAGAGIATVNLKLSSLKTVLGGVMKAVALSERKYLSLLLDALLSRLVDRVNLGVMVNHYDGKNVTGAACFTGTATGHDSATRLAQAGCSNGAYLLIAAKALTTANLSSTVSEITTKLDGMRTAIGTNTADNALHPYQGKEVYYEAIQYFEGDSVYNGHLGYHDYGDSSNSTNLNTSFPALSWSTSHEDGSNNYLSPYDATTPGVDGSCGPAFMINVMLSNSKDDAESDIRIRTDYPDIQNTIVDGDADTDGLDDLSFEDVVEYMRTTGFRREASPSNFVQTTIQSYFLLNGPANSSLLSNVGSSVLSLPLNINPFSFTNEFDGVEAEVTLSTSVSQTTPVSPVKAGRPAEFTNDLFVGLFQPNPSGLPRWSGNLKKLKYDAVDNRIEDALGAAAVGTNGRIVDGSRTYWTDAPTDDGSDVELGGAGAEIAGVSSGSPGLTNSSAGARKLFTEPASGTALLALNADDATAALLQSAYGSASVSDAKRMIQFSRGYGGQNVTTPVKRSWMMGGILHSQPVALNYGIRGGYSASNPDVRILFGSMDGLFRMVRNTTTGGAESGAEVWGFMPRAVMPDIPTLQANADGDPVVYGVDGPPVVYTLDINSDGNLDSTAGDKVWVFFGLRRGGKAYYGLDISDPDNPTYLWKITNTGDYSGLGLTFSTPRLSNKTFPTPVTGVTKTGPVLLFGGGYNGGLDVSDNPIGKDAAAGSDGVVGSNDSVGNAIYMVDAQTGLLIWKAGYAAALDFADADFSDRGFEHPLMRDSIASTITALDTDGDGQMDRGYVGDTGGRVWRIDMAGSDISTWSAVPILSVGRHNDLTANGAADVIDDRRFFHRPDFVKARDFQGGYDAVIIGSGDREDPFNDLTVNNVYMFKDRNIASGLSSAQVNATLTEASLPGHFDAGSGVTLYDVSSSCDGSVACPASSSLATGWRFQLGDSDAGEKMVSTPTTISGTVFFTTFTPPLPTGECAIEEGSGRIYGVGLANANPSVTQFFQSADSSTDPDGDNRSTLLTAPGYADSVVYIGDGKILRSDLAPQDVVDRSTRPTFWRERLSAEEEPLDQN